MIGSVALVLVSVGKCLMKFEVSLIVDKLSESILVDFAVLYIS